MKKIREETVKTVVYYILIFILVVIFSYGCWRAERYINWKFGYGPKIERRIQSLEDRIRVLEGK